MLKHPLWCHSHGEAKTPWRGYIPLWQDLPYPTLHLVQRLLRLSVLYSPNRIQNSESPRKSTGAATSTWAAAKASASASASAISISFLWLRNSFVYIFLINFNTEIVDGYPYSLPHPPSLVLGCAVTALWGFLILLSGPGLFCLAAKL